MAKKTNRVIVKLKSTESNYRYHTEKSRANNKERLAIRKYDPTVRRHVIFKEER